VCVNECRHSENLSRGNPLLGHNARPGNLEPEAWATRRSLLDVIEACKVSGEPRDVAMIEEDLRARLAVPIDAHTEKPPENAN
jgi:hypothetical protein